MSSSTDRIATEWFKKSSRRPEDYAGATEQAAEGANESSLNDKEKEEATNPFTQFYGQCAHQANMMADHVRTSTYQRAIYNNAMDFTGKVVMDAGTGSGILAFFALQAGAARVYAVDASDAVHIAQKLADANGLSDRLTVIKGRIEEINIPEYVDVIVSEPIGFLLVHERMLESYVAARDRFLKPDGLMFPSTGDMILAPFTDDDLFKEQLAKLTFWENTDFYGIDLSSIRETAAAECFAQPIVGYVAPRSLMSAHRTIQTIDFSAVSGEELQNFEVPFSFVIDVTGIMHGIAGWFDLSFLGSAETVILSTAPEREGTHWYQCRLLLQHAVAVNRGQSVSGSLVFRANESFSYFIDLTVQLDGTNIVSRNTVNLKDQQYSYLQPAAAPI